MKHQVKLSHDPYYYFDVADLDSFDDKSGPYVDYFSINDRDFMIFVGKKLIKTQSVHAVGLIIDFDECHSYLAIATNADEANSLADSVTEYFNNKYLGSDADFSITDFLTTFSQFKKEGDYYK